jgi:hypothetical protein
MRPRPPYQRKTTTKAADVPIPTTTRRKPMGYGNKRPTTTTEPPADAPVFDCTVLPDGNYPSGKCERTYYSCSAQRLTVQHCPGRQIFDPANDWCDSPANTETCTGTPRTEPPTPATSALPPVEDIHFSCEGKPNGDHPNPNEQCSYHYFSCSSGVPSKRKCPLGLFFDPEMLLCDTWIKVPACSGKPRMEETTIPTRETTQSPFDCTDKKNGNYPDPSQPCSHIFYTCFADETNTFLCPDDLAYDPDQKRCERKEYIVACGGAPPTEPPPQDETTLAPVDFDCSGQKDGLYMDPKDKCSYRYFACVSEIPREFLCPDNLVFSVFSQACVRKEESFECTGTEPTTQATTEFVPSTTVAVPFDCSEQPDGFFADTTKPCSDIYFSCSGGIALQLQCPAGLYYDVDQKACDFYHQVFACSGNHPTKWVPESTVEFTTAVPEYDCTHLENGHYPIPGEKCSQEFFTCGNGFTYKERCPGALYWDPDTNACDSYGNIFACTGTTKAPTTTMGPRDESATTEKLPVECLGQPDGEYVDPEKACSNVFYMCANQVAFRLECPKGLYYEKDLKVCMEWLDVMDCAGKPRPSTTTKETTTYTLPMVPIDCSSLPDGDHAHPEEKCSPTFFTCSNGIGFERHCAFDLVFDVVIGACDSRDIVEACTGKPRPETTEGTTVRYETTTQPFDCSQRESGNYAAADCANYYWVCAGGVALWQDCPHGTKFDEEMGLCDFAENIPKCGGERTTTTEATTLASTTQNSVIDCTKLSDGNFPDPENACSFTFYMCSGGISFPQRCPGGLKFDVDLNQCGHPDEIIACGGSKTTTPPADEPSTTTRKRKY